MHRGRHLGRGFERSGRPVPRYQQFRISSPRVSRRYADRAQHGGLDSRIRQPRKFRNRHVAHRSAQSTRRTRHQLRAHQPGRQTQRSAIVSYMTDERRMIHQAARDFAMNEVLPIANKLDPEQGDIPMSLRDKLAEMGYFGVVIPEEYGGLGLGAFEYALITEELARAWMSVASIIARGNSLWGGVTEEDKRRYFPKIARGEWLGAFSLSEPDAGSDLANVACKATRAGDQFVINGTKTWCTFADGADYIVLFARTSPPTDPKRRHVGISQFLIQKERGSFPPGITGSPIRKIGYFGWKTYELHFDNFHLPASALLGHEGRGFYAMMSAQDT